MTIALNRRTIVLGLPLIGAAPLTFAAGQNVRQVSGRVTNGNYRGFEAFLLDSLDSTIGLKITVAVNDEDSDGVVSAYEREEQFTIYRPGPDQLAELVISDGYEVDGHTCRLDGFFSISASGMHEGVATLLLAADEAPDGAQIEDFDIDKLPTETQN
jgi:hypothetical protein